MPFKLNETNISPLAIDYDYEIIDKDLLASYVGEMVLGNHNHITKIINSLSSTFPCDPDKALENTINKIQNTSIEKRDGWLFQMISWIVLGNRHQGQKFFANYPHFAPAQHGIDGLAIVLNPDDSLKSIIITEDKCTENPRNLITQQVFPELKQFESGEKDNALISIIGVLLSHINSGLVFEKARNDIYDTKFRIYRIGITRATEHNDEAGRKKLFKDYEKNVLDDECHRRSGATIHIEDLRVWMQDFAEKVIKYLESKKGKHV